MHNCCNDYTRSQLLRCAAAEAGKGLPAIEPGMPEPAGTGLSRRSFLSRSAGLALAVYGASKIPLSAFETRHRRRRRRRDKILVSVFFEGGIDALSVLAPVGDPALRAAAAQPRPRPRRRHRPSPRTRACSWHPAAAGLATLHDEGKVSAFPAIGYDHPDQSHFTSRHYYEIGELDGRLPHRLAGPLHRRGRRRRKPAPGPLDGRLALADDRHRRTAGGGDRQRRRLRPLVAGQRPGRGRDVQQLRPLRLAALGLRRPDPGPQRDRPDRQAARANSAASAPSPARSPIPKPTSPTSSPASPPTSPSACRCGW